MTATYNDLDSVKALFDKYKGEVAGVILEPVVGNSGYIEPTQKFLQASNDSITAWPFLQSKNHSDLPSRIS